MSSHKNVWATSDDGRIEFVSVMKEHIPGSLKLLRNAFFIHESACIAVSVSENFKAMEELEELTMITIRDGVSIVAVEKSTNKIVGGAFNKLQVRGSTGEASFFEDFAKRCKQPASRELVEFMIKADATVNLFDVCNVDCIMEIMFVMSDPNFRRLGIGKKLCQCSIQLGRELLKGNNVKRSLDGTSLPLQPVPRAASALFTSFRSQKIGRSLGFTIANEISYDEFEHEGIKFSDLIDKESPTTTVEYIML